MSTSEDKLFEEFKSLFSTEEDFELIVKNFENGDFENFEQFCVYFIQDYFNFLELEKDFPKEKKDMIRDFYSNLSS